MNEVAIPIIGQLFVCPVLFMNDLSPGVLSGWKLQHIFYWQWAGPNKAHNSEEWHAHRNRYVLKTATKKTNTNLETKHP